MCIGAAQGKSEGEFVLAANMFGRRFSTPENREATAGCLAELCYSIYITNLIVFIPLDRIAFTRIPARDTRAPKHSQEPPHKVRRLRRRVVFGLICPAALRDQQRQRAQRQQRAQRVVQRRAPSAGVGKGCAGFILHCENTCCFLFGD